MNDSEKKTGIGSFGLFSLGFGAIVGVGWAVSINRWMAHLGGPDYDGAGGALLCGTCLHDGGGRRRDGVCLPRL